MEQCPVELWREITALACTDGGYTGCSLSLVSHTMRDIIEPIRYDSVALTSFHQYPAFARSLREADGRSPIRHLFFSIEEPVIPPEYLASKMPYDSIHPILLAAAPSLRTLAVHGIPSFYLPNTVFPSLTHLSSPYRRFPKSVQFPQLRRYCLIGQHTFTDIADWLAQFAPTITHLRLPDITRSWRIIPYLRVLLHGPSSPPVPNPSGTARPIARFIGYTDTHYVPGSDKERRALDLAAKLPELVHILVQQTDSDVFIRNEEFHATLREIAQASPGGYDTGRRLHVLPDAPEQDPYSVAQAREYQQWQDLVEGGDGLWQLPDI